MTTLCLISSMATKALLADLAALYQNQNPDIRVEIESVGGVDAAKRVEGGEAFDGVVLASNAIDKLIASGHVLAGSRSEDDVREMAEMLRAYALRHLDRQTRQREAADGTV